MPSRACGYCGVHAHFTPVGLRHIAFEDEGYLEYVQSGFECAACGLMSLGTTDLVSGMPGYRAQVKEGSERSYWELIGVDTWLPGNDGPKIENLPAAVATAAGDAYKSFKSRVYTAAVLMARTTIEATAKHHGITGRNLLVKIDKMHEEGLILQSTKLAAHAIRSLGNDMAHGDLELSIGRDVARDVVELMQLILREVFELPYLATKLQERADERVRASQALRASSP